MSVKQRLLVSRIAAVSLALFAFVVAPLSYSGVVHSQVQRPARPQSDRRVARRADVPPGSTYRNLLITESGRQQIAALVAEKDSRTPAQRKIDSRLLQAVRESRGEQMAAGVNLIKADIKADDTGILTVDISAKVTDDLLTRIKNLGGTIIYPSVQYNTIRARIKLSDVETIAGYAEVQFIQPAVAAFTNRFGGDNKPKVAPSSAFLASPSIPLGPARLSLAERAEILRTNLANYVSRKATAPMFTGSVTSEGDRTHRADDARNLALRAGEGVRIGVLSDSFNSNGFLAGVISSGDLPGADNPLGNLTPVTVVQDFPTFVLGNVELVQTDEGNPILQIVHDVAPKAQLFFATALISEANFAANILALRSAPYNCDIIIDDIEYGDEPPFQDGIIAQAVNTVTADGALYFSSAGNEGSLAKRTSGVWEGDFTDAGSTLIIPGFGRNFDKAGTVLNFGSVSSPIEGNTITTPGFFQILTWSDPQGESSNDYDLFIMDPTLTTVLAASTNFQDGSENPFEAIGGMGPGDKLVVFKSSDAAPRAIHLSTFRGTLAVATNGETHGHSAAANAFSVAATPAAGAFDSNSPIGPFPNPFSSSNVVENFSSDGPRRIFYNPDGTTITPGNLLFATNGGIVRNKPDITAADGVSFAEGSFFIQPPFFGTSAAAPHAGAIAALLKTANPSLTPGQIRSILTSTALDIESPGNDNVSGFGIVQAFQAMQAALPSAQPNLSLGPVTATEGTFSNHNGKIEPGETVNVVVSLTNPTQSPVTNVKATLSSQMTGVGVPRNAAAYGTIPASGSVDNSGSPFTVGLRALTQFETPPSQALCGAQLSFTLTVSYDGATDPLEFTVSIKLDSRKESTISAKLGQPGPDGAEFTTFSGVQTGALTRTGTPSSCSNDTPQPSLVDTTGIRQYDSYTFVNHGPDQCVNVTMTSARGANLYTAAYQDIFDLGGGSITDNFLAAAGSSSNQQSFSFMVKAGQTIVIVVHEVEPGAGFGSQYKLSLSLQPSFTLCDPGPSCVLFSTPVSLPVGAVGVPYNQTLSANGGSGFATISILTFPEFGGNFLPLGGLLLTNNVISGTPTQAGTFDFNAVIKDPVCTGIGEGQGYALKITGNLPASITAVSGDGQSLPPGGSTRIPLQAVVRDSAGSPLPGVAVLFELDPFDPPLPGTFNGPTTILTDANGLATAPTFTASNLSESYAILATVNGLDPARFNLTTACASVVSNTADNGPGSLRDTIANACERSLITFDPGVTGTIALTSGEILIKNKSLFVQGPGANVLTISGSHASRIFTVASDNSEQLEVFTISGLTLKNGKPSPSDTNGGGGALLINRSIVQITDSVIANNDVSNSAAGSGGGIEVGSGSTLIISRSAIVHNTATTNGGGIHLASTGTLSIIQSTIASNSAGSSGRGGGIEIDSPSVVQIENVTISGNSANAGGNISSGVGPTIATSTLFALTKNIIGGGLLIGESPTGADVNNILFSGPTGDFNLIQDATSTALTDTPHNISGVDPLLLPLGNYGGPSPTILPRPDSPALGAGPGALLAPNPLGPDQRGVFKPFSDFLDLGAVQTSYVVKATNGINQATAILTNFPTPLQAIIVESGINTVFSGVKVTFVALPFPASGFFNNSSTATVLTDSDGVATAPPLTANSSTGTVIVEASIGRRFPTGVYVLTNLSPPASVTATGGTPQNAPPGSAFQTLLQATVRDSDGNSTAGISVTFTAPSTGASGTFAGGSATATVLTDNSGNAISPVFTANGISGSYIVTASVDGVVTPAQFSLRNILPGPPNSISASAGRPQTVTIGCDFITSLRATVLDASNVPVGGATVTFTVTPNGNTGATFAGNAISAIALTDNNGNASAPILTANEFAGSYTVTARVTGVVSPATYDLTNRIKFGDLTGEGTVNVQDLLVMANILAGNIHPTTGRKMMADVFQDSGHLVNVQDLLVLANFLAGNITTLPVVPTAQNAKTTPDYVSLLNGFSSDWSNILNGSELQKIDDNTAHLGYSLNLNRPETPFTISELHWQSPEFWIKPFGESHIKTVYRLRGT